MTDIAHPALLRIQVCDADTLLIDVAISEQPGCFATSLYGDREMVLRRARELLALYRPPVEPPESAIDRERARAVDEARAGVRRRDEEAEARRGETCLCGFTPSVCDVHEGKEPT